MIKTIITYSITNRWVIVLFSVLIMAAGVWSFYQLKIEAYPDIADTNVTIITKYNGKAAEDVEQQVTIPIERVLNNIPKVTTRRSRTIFGLSVVQLNFEDGTDDYFARQQVSQRLSDAELPIGVTPTMAPLTSAVGEIYRYIIEAPSSYSPMDLRVLQDWVIIPKLLQTPGLADIATFGGPVKQFHIITSPVNLRKYNLDLQDIIDAINKNNQNTGGNIISRGSQGFAIRGIGFIKNSEDIENIVLTTSNGVPVFIKNVGTVEINPPPASGILGVTIPDDSIDINNGTEGIILLRRHENPSEVLKDLKKRIQDLEEHDLPKDVKLRVLYDRSFLIDHSLETVAHTVLEGITIAIVVIFLFLGSLRSALVVAVTIPFSLLFAFILMKLTNIPANLLSLGAIDFGIIVDGAGRIAENMIRRIETANEKEKKEGLLSICGKGAKEVGKEVFFCVAIIIVAYLPIFTMQRVEGKLFSPMALTLAFALLGSMVCALTLIPALISWAYADAFTKSHHAEGWFEKVSPFKHIQVGYAKLLNQLLKIPKLVIGTMALILIISTIFITKIGTEFLPRLDEGSIWLRCNLPAGVTLQETAKLAPKIRQIVSKYHQVAIVVTQSGRNDDGTDPLPANRTEIFIGLKEYKYWADTITKKELVRMIQTDLENNLPGTYLSFGQPIIDQVMEIVTGSAADLAVSVIGSDLSMMRVKADSILTIVKNMKGSDGVNIEQEGRQAQIAIKIDRKTAARYGINVSDIQLIIESAIGGKEIGVIYDQTKRFDIVVRYYPENRSTIEAIKLLQVPSITGSYIPLKEVASIEYVDGETNIYRQDGKRMVTVRTNIKDRDQGSFVAELREKINNKISLPEGYKIIYGGQFENLERASKRLTIAIPMTLIVVFLFLFILFRDITNTLIVFACVPLGVAGGLMALLLRGYNFNISAGVGIISLFGISAMTGIMAISFLNTAIKEIIKKHEEGDHQQLKLLELKNIIIEICREQLRPKMMVMIVAMLALIPAATSTGIGSDVQRPLATVIIGGLISTLIFTPFIIPCLYWLFAIKKQNLDEDIS